MTDEHDFSPVHQNNASDISIPDTTAADSDMNKDILDIDDGMPKYIPETHQNELASKNTGVEKKFLGQLLLEKQLLTDEKLNYALSKQQETHSRLGHILVDLGYVSENDIIHALEEQFGLPCISINVNIINAAVVRLIPEEICRQFRLIPILLDGNNLTIACTNPYDLTFIDLIHFNTEYKVTVTLATEKSVMESINQVYGTDKLEIDSNFMLGQQAYLKQHIKLKRSGVSELPSVAKIVDNIILTAYKHTAKEIQLEYFREGNLTLTMLTKQRFIPLKTPPVELYPSISARIKKLAKLNTFRHDIFQEGLVNFNFGNVNIPARVFVFPSAVGENILIKFA